MSGRGISIELSVEQVQEVLRRSLSGVGSVKNISFEEVNRQDISYPLLRGLLVLGSFPLDGGHRTAEDVVSALGIRPTTVRRSLATLVALGLLERDRETQSYRRATA
jgi:DNA-binding MarR family transcriptional regulator